MENGRVERFFRTFKEYADKVFFYTEHLQSSLNEFAFWYNQVRPHRHLYGRTPHEAWNHIDPYAQAPVTRQKFTAWEGVLTGFHMEYD